MKKTIIVFFALLMSFSALVTPWSVRADGGTTVQSTSTASLEAQLNGVQRELIVLLNKRLSMLQAEYRIMLEGKLRGLQLQLLGLLEQQLTILRAQANNR